MISDCCIAGGGPAGIMLGFLLARAGVNVVILEKHADFFRDFRGDTIHPSTLKVMEELGLIDDFLKLPHDKAYQMTGNIGGEEIVLADLTTLSTPYPYIAFIPQWDFLTFLSTQGKRYPTFQLLMNAEATGLIEENGRVAGLRAKTESGNIEIRADLVVGADGRHSTVRKLSRLPSEDIGAPIDVLWMKLPKMPGDPTGPQANLTRGKMLVMLDRGNYWQCAYVIRKGGYDELKPRGLDAFKKDLVEAVPILNNRTETIKSWDDVSLLTVTVDRLTRWHKPGLLCIGDAAHAMSPVGGVGINLAIQDAVAAANILAEPLRNKNYTENDLAKVQQRRTFPTKATQAFQVFFQNRIFTPVLKGEGAFRVPGPLRMLQRFPILRWIPARVIGIGFRPEHVHTPNIFI